MRSIDGPTFIREKADINGNVSVGLLGRESLWLNAQLLDQLFFRIHSSSAQEDLEHKIKYLENRLANSNLSKGTCWCGQPAEPALCGRHQDD